MKYQIIDYYTGKPWENTDSFDTEEEARKYVHDIHRMKIKDGEIFNILTIIKPL